MKTATLFGSLALLAATCVAAADKGLPPMETKVNGVPAGKPGQWVELSVTIQAKKCNISALAVDRTTGDLFILPMHGPPHGHGGKGIWKSTDRGTTFARVDQGTVTGGGWNPATMDLCPEGGRLAVFPMYGQGAITLDGGTSWRPIGEHFDYGSVDWTDPEAKTIMATHHERAPGMRFSFDGGKTWTPLDISYRCFLGVPAAKTLLVCKGKTLEMSTDGKSWKTVSEIAPISPASRMFKGSVYYLSAKGLLVSKDKGVTWHVQGEPLPDKTAWIGPYFGRDEKHILAVGSSGISETTDGGHSWQIALPLPSPYQKKVPGLWGAWTCGPFLGYDPAADIFYLAFANYPTFRYERGKAAR